MCTRGNSHSPSLEEYTLAIINKVSSSLCSELLEKFRSGQRLELFERFERFELFHVARQTFMVLRRISFCKILPALIPAPACRHKIAQVWLWLLQGESQLVLLERL